LPTTWRARAFRSGGARLLEKLLNDPDLPQPQPELEPGEQRTGYRSKVLLINLGWITLRRPYLYSRSGGQGRCPLDSAWGFVDSYSPEVLRLSCRAAALAGSYEAASQDLLTYAGLEIDARQLQRLVSLMAPVMNRWRHAQQPSLPGATCGEVMCIRPPTIGNSITFPVSGASTARTSRASSSLGLSKE
jgi:hypothetical protein